MGVRERRTCSTCGRRQCAGAQSAIDTELRGAFESEDARYDKETPAPALLESIRGVLAGPMYRSVSGKSLLPLERGRSVVRGDDAARADGAPSPGVMTQEPEYAGEIVGQPPTRGPADAALGERHCTAEPWVVRH